MVSLISGKVGFCQVQLMQKQSLDLCLGTLGFRDFISDMGVGGLIGFSDRENGYKGYDCFGTEGIGKDCGNSMTVMGTRMNNRVGVFSTNSQISTLRFKP